MLQAILEVCESLSGQQLNLNKSKKCQYHSSGQNKLQKTLGIGYMEGHHKYLGLKQQVCNRTNRWKEKLLSQARREVLIKSVRQAILAYAIGVFKILFTLCDEIHSFICNF